MVSIFRYLCTKLGVTEQNSVLKTSPFFSALRRCCCGEKSIGEVDQYSMFEEVCSVTQPKEVQIVYRLFLVNCYLLHVPRLPYRPASNAGG